MPALPGDPMSLLKPCSLLLSLALLTAQGSVINAQTNKRPESKPKKKDRAANKDASAQLVPYVPEPIPQPPPPRPANGSLYADNAPNSSLLGDFKAGGIGDLVFIEVVEESVARSEER